MRIACLLVPDLPLRAELRANPELAGESLVITSGPGTRAEVVTVSARARAQGVHPGQTLPQARAVAPDLVVRIASPALERAARETLLDVAFSLAPRAESAPRAAGLFASEGAVYVDASGIEALHESERAFASVLRARAEGAGLGGVVALASSRGVARLAARHLAHTAEHEPGTSDTSDTSDTPDTSDAPDLCVLTPERELDFMAPLPIDLLDPSDRTAQALTRFGIHRIHDLLRLSRRDLAARLGTELLDLVARARGEAQEPPLPEPRLVSLEEGVDLEVPIASLEPLTFVLRGIVSRLVERLEMRALGGHALRLEMQLEERRRDHWRIGVASPCQDARVLLRLVRLAIESRPPTAAVLGLQLRCEGVPLRRDQLDLFLPRGPSPNELDETLAELAALCGADRVGAPSVVDDHRPDAYALKPFAPRSAAPPTARSSSASRRAPSGRRGFVPHSADSRRDPPGSPTYGSPGRRPRLTLRALRPPLRAEVRTRSGRPAFVRSTLGQGEIRAVAGPWRTTGHWWSSSAHFAVDHYDVQMSDDVVLRLCFDWKTKRWQIDGLYD